MSVALLVVFTEMYSYPWLKRNLKPSVKEVFIRTAKWKILKDAHATSVVVKLVYMGGGLQV